MRSPDGGIERLNWGLLPAPSRVKRSRSIEGVPFATNTNLKCGEDESLKIRIEAFGLVRRFAENGPARRASVNRVGPRKLLETKNQLILEAELGRFLGTCEVNPLTERSDSVIFYSDSGCRCACAGS